MDGLRARSPSVAARAFERSDGRDDATSSGTIEFALFECKRITRGNAAMQRARASASSAVVDDYVAYLGGAVWTMDWLARAKTADVKTAYDAYAPTYDALDGGGAASRRAPCS